MRQSFMLNTLATAFAGLMLVLGSHTASAEKPSPPSGGSPTAPIYQKIAIGKLYGSAVHPFAVQATTLQDGSSHVQCVGYVQLNNNDYIACYWEAVASPPNLSNSYQRTVVASPVTDVNIMASGGWVDLSDLSSSPSGWLAISSVGVNSSGQIACNARNASGQRRACIFDPVTKTLQLLPLSNNSFTSTLAINGPINAHGDVLYSVTDLAGVSTTVVCDGVSRFYSEYTLPNPTGLSNNGQLVGGIYSDGYCYRYDMLNDSVEIFNAISPHVSPNGVYLLAQNGGARRYTNPASFVAVSGKYTSHWSAGVNSHGDCAVRIYASRNSIWFSLYHNGNSFNINAIIGLPNDNKTDITGISERDITGYPWMCGTTSGAEPLIPLLLMPIK